MENLSGQNIKGYELRQRIGAGGFGAVYQAYQSTVGREVAVKVILPGFSNQPDFIRRFEIEARLVARLEHLHIVPLYDYWRDPGGAYLVMRWLRGGSLKSALQTGPFDLDSTALLLDQVTAGLATAHNHNIIHRDLKPSNILLDEEGNAYLADFGIAKDLNSPANGATKSEMIVGSPDYLSPEQARSEAVTPQTDIYSLGVTLYETLAGKHPFPDISPVERLFKHINDPLPRIESLDPGVSSAVNDVIQKATAKNPKHRYQNVLEMATAFREAAKLTQVGGAASIVETLTKREQEILSLIVDGLSNKEIARKLSVEVSTVKWYITQIYRKLRVRSRMQAIVRARELQLIAPDLTEATTSISLMLPEPANPYKGLRAFEAADSRDFFGRETLIEKLVKRLGETGSLSRFLAVVGPSGSGKSSLVKAGLIPALWRGALPGSDRWFIIEMTPSANPLDELEVALTRIAADQSANIREHLERDERGLLRVAGLILPQDGSELVIVIDQFEEAFTLVEDEAARSHFLDLLHGAVTGPRSRVQIVITLRADFYDRPLHYPQFGELIRSRMETLLPLTASGLERAITRPAQQVGMAFEPGLAALISDEVNYQPGALPLLQYALTELFEQRSDHLLTRQAYQAIGGAVGALARRAEEIYHELDAEGQEATRQMFLRLVTVSEEAGDGQAAPDTRRRVPRAELLSISLNEEVMDEIIDTFAAYRLLSLDHDPASRRPTVEVAHEALLREWAQLRNWLEESRADIRTQRLLAAAAAEWRAANRDPSYLLRGARLAQFEDWAEKSAVALTLDERAFLDDSLTARQTRQAEEKARQQRELKAAQRLAETEKARAEAEHRRAEEQAHAAGRVKRGALLLAGVSVIAIILAVIAFAARATAQRAADVNHSLVLAADAQDANENGDVDLALALALEAANVDQPPPETLRALSTVALGPGTRAILKGHSNSVRTVAFAPDSKIALSGSCAELDPGGNCVQGELILWDVSAATSASLSTKLNTGLESAVELKRLSGHTNWVNGAAFSPDGQTALSGSGDGTLILWNVETGEVIRRFEGHTGGVNSVAFSPDGQTALSGSDDATLILWDISTALNTSVAKGEEIRRFKGHTGGVNAIAFSPDGQTALSGSDDSALILWNVATGEEIRRIEGHTGEVEDLAFTPDGSAALSTANDQTLRLWNLETGEQTRQEVFGGGANFLAISPDGRTAVHGVDYELRLRDIGQWQERGRLLGHPKKSPVRSIAISPDGRLILSGAEDGSLILWNLAGQDILDRFQAGEMLFAVDVSPDGRRVLVGGATGDPILWDVERSQIIRRFKGDGIPIDPGGAAFSPDGRYALTAAEDVFGESGATSLILWDIERGEKIRRFEEHITYARSAAFSPDGRMALSGSQDFTKEGAFGDLILWEVETGRVIRRFDSTDDITSIVFSADGSRALTGSAYFTNATLWDVATGQKIRRFEGHEGPVFSVVFGPDEATALSSSEDGSIILWDIETGDIIRRYLGHERGVWGLDISPDGCYIISGSDDGVVILWDFETGEELRRFNGHTAWVPDLAFSPDGQSAFSVSMDGSLIQWQISDQPLDELVDWTHANRYIRDLTCDERAQYRIEPLCKE